MKILKNGKDSFTLNSKGFELLKNTGIIGLGKIGTYIVSFLLLPMYTLYLSPESYGNIELVNNYATLLVYILTLQIEQGCFRYLIDIESKSEQGNKIISTSFIGLFIQMFICTIIVLLCNILFNIEYIFFIILNAIGASILTLLQQVSRGCGNNKAFAMSGFIATVVAMVCSCIGVVILKWDVEGVLFATSLSYFIAILYLVSKKYLIIRISDFKWDTYILILKYSVPLIANSISWWIFNVSDRSIINWVLGVSYTGIYSIANKFPGIGMTMYSIFNMAWTESVARNIGDKKDEKKFLTNSMAQVYGIFSTIIFGLIAVMPIIFPILINQTYFEAYYQVPILFLSVLSYSVSAMYGAVYIALKRTKKIAWTSSLAAVLNIAVNMICIKSLGLYAASISTLASYSLLAIYRMIDVKKELDIYIDKKIILLSICTAILVVFLAYQKNMWYVFINIGLVAVYCMVVNKGIIKSFSCILDRSRK